MTSDPTDPRHHRSLPQAPVLLLFLAALLTLFSRFFHPNLFGYFEDDFFYYAQVARNLATGHGSTFDSIHLTNGYHPLWMLVILLLYKLFPGTALFVAVQVVSLAAILAFFFGALRCLRYLGLPERLAPLTALLLSLHALLLLRFGMEVTLALPLGIWTLATILNPQFRWTPAQTVLYGLLACATILARLDNLFLIAALLTAQWTSKHAAMVHSVVPRRPPDPELAEGEGPLYLPLSLFALCFLPLLGDLAFNLLQFHTLLPVSGQAKQLKPLLPPSLTTLHSLVLPFDRTKAAFVYPALLAILAGLLAFRRSAPLLSPLHRNILIALFAFPVLHLASLSLLSDWTVWPWYFYSLIYPVLASAVLLLTPLRDLVPASPRWRIPVANLTLLIGAYILFLSAYSLFKKPSKTSQLAVFVADFSRQHPGTYAMGDDAGSTAFRSDQPFLQLEGLMMDADYIQVLRHRTPLAQVLHRYHVDYYVALQIERTGPCFLTHEPAQAGPHSPHLPGRICAQPLAQHTEDGVSVGIFRASDVLAP
jgi:hypothetical protein